MFDNSDLRKEAFTFAKCHVNNKNVIDPDYEAEDLYTRIMSEIDAIAKVEGFSEIERLFYSSESISIARFAHDYGIV